MRAHEFINEHNEEQLDEFLPLITAAGGALARGAAAAGGALARGARVVGGAALRGAAAAGRGIAQGAEAVGRGIAQAVATPDQPDPEQAEPELKAGGRVSVPKLGAVDIIAVTSTGVTLNTQSQLGFNITVDPRALQQ